MPRKKGAKPKQPQDYFTQKKKAKRQQTPEEMIAVFESLQVALQSKN